MKNCRVLFVLLWVLAVGFAGGGDAAAATSRVTAEGRAAGDTPNARALALTDALREAVRLGAGVDVLSTTGVKDFVLQFDRVFETAFGYVRNYSIVESGLGADGLYRVKINAEVGEGTPGRQDVVALKQIVSLKKSPRVALRVNELIEGVPAGSNLAGGWFEEQARAMQLQLIDLGQAGVQNDKMAARDQLVGDAKMAAFRAADIPQNVDFLLEVNVRGSHGGRESVYGVELNKFSLGADLRAVRADNGAIIASVALPTWEGLSKIATMDGAARELVHRLLAGDTGVPDAPGAWSLFRNILAQWVAELDLGTIYKVDFKGIEDAEYGAVQTALKGNERITSVWDREFDSAGLSTIDVESRLEAQELKKAILGALGTSFKFDRGTAHHLQFVRSAQPVLPVPEPAHRSGLPLAAWVGLGLLAAGGSALFLLRKKPSGGGSPPSHAGRGVGAGGSRSDGHDIFISYARVDDKRVYDLVNRLKSLGARVWTDQDIDPGAKFSAELVRAIETSHTVIIFLSEQSVLRPYLQKEATLALSENRNLLPVFLDDNVKLPPELKLQFVDIQHLQIHGKSAEEATEMILRALRKLGLPLGRAE